MIDSLQIAKMSVSERLQVIDEIWESLNRHSHEIPSPEWHQEVLNDRKARALRGEAKFLTLDQLRTRLRSSES
jgi:putative addiction module component (TIGR02574 family)